VTVTAPQLIFAGNSQSAFLCSSPGTPSLAGDNVYFPAVMNGISDVRSMSLGVNHSLYLKSDGTAWASGSNTVGQLGDNTNTNRTAPVQVNGLTGITFG
jgi:alpha-tubulin suppressor-like RCC1 family protein